MVTLRIASEYASDDGATPRVVRLPDSDFAVVRAIRAGEPSGSVQLFDRYYAHVRRVLLHVLGPDAELTDLVQEVFLTAISSIDRLREPAALKSWIGSIAVHTARRRLRERQRSRLFQLFPFDALPERLDTSVADPEVGEAARAVYRVLDALSTEDRLVFALRFIDSREIAEIAAVCESSVSTVKRRLARATQRFARHARREASLTEYLERAPWNP